MSTSSVVVRFTRASLAALCAALLEHADRLEDLLKPSWYDTNEVQDEMYHLVDTLIFHGED
jgi:hypothetical protein